MSVAAVQAPTESAEDRGAALRAVIAHDWLVNYAGSERVVEQLRRLFPTAPVLTTLVRPGAVPASLADATPSFLQRIPGAAANHEWLLPAMPLAWRLRQEIQEADVVISSSHACAKAVRVAAGIPHICYCHTPMRYAWDFASERERFPSPVRPAARALMAGMRRWDLASAENVDVFVANSTAVAARIRRHYDRPSHVVHPPVDTEYFTPGGSRGDFFLYVGRLVAYKSASLVVDAFAQSNERLVVVGAGHLLRELQERATPNVSFAGEVDRQRLRELYRTAQAMVYPAEEDFGIAMAEAQACGTPVIGLGRGGAVDVVVDGATGLLMPEQSVGAIRSALVEFRKHQFDSSAIATSATRFSEARFRSALLDVVDSTVRRGR